MNCAICGNSEAMHSERRASGREGRMQTWNYCPECWQMLMEQQQDKDPWIAARYTIFLQWLAGHYDRRILYRHAYHLLPPKRTPYDMDSGPGNRPF
jgi:hypothetical protein